MYKSQGKQTAVYVLYIWPSYYTWIHARVGETPWHVTSHTGQLGLLLSEGWKMSTSQSAVLLCCWE